MGHYVQVYQYVQCALDVGLTGEEVWVGLIETLRLQQKYEQAEIAGKSALKVHSESGRIYHAIAITFIVQWKLDLARYLLKKGEVRTKDPTLQGTMGYLRQQQEYAIWILEYKLALPDHSVVVDVALSVEYLKQKQYDKALSMLEPFRETYPNESGLWLNLGIVYWIMGRLDEAE